MSDTPDLGTPALENRLGRRELLVGAGKILGAAALAGPLASTDFFGAGAALAATKQLDVWYLSGSPAETTWVTGLANAFGKKHGTTATITPYDFDPMNQALKLALSTQSGPDVAYANPSPQDIGFYEKNGWIIDLNPYAKKYGWAKRFSPDVYNYNDIISYRAITPRAGIPYDIVGVGWFYNPKIFAKYGLRAPTTFTQLQSTMAKLKAKGVTPFSAGGLNIANPGTLHYVFEQLVHSLVARSTLQKLILLDPKSTWVLPGVIQALTIVQTWVKNGYLEANALATSGIDSDALFSNGQVAMTVNGTWNNAAYLQSATGFSPRFFPMPRINPKIPWAMSGYTPNLSWVISSYAKDKALAAQYLDYMLGPHAATVAWNNSDIPAYRFAKAPKPKSQLQADVYAAMAKTQTGFYLSTSGFFHSQYRPTLEKAFSLASTPQEVVQELQANYVRTVNGG